MIKKEDADAPTGHSPLRGLSGFLFSNSAAGARGTIYTAGYRGRTPEEVLSLARRLNAIVVDVRYRAQSRIRGFNKSELRRLLGERYLHVRALGNGNYKSCGPVKLLDADEGVRIVGGLLCEGRNVLLLCACKELDGCHRRDAADLLTAVVHGPPPRHLLAHTR
jgi:hypothetical protein